MSKPIAKPPVKSPKGANQLRIIGGLWRGRKLAFPDVDGLRPTGDRIRETLFNWLAPDIQGAHCLDLFAGSGALGLEALSRGAAASVLIERDQRAAAQLKSNLALLNAEGGKVLQMDALAYLHNLPTAGQTMRFDVVFIDPPFQLNLWQQVIDQLAQHSCLNEGAAIYIESGLQDQYLPPPDWELHRDKTAGNLRYRLFYYHPETRA
ncbi:16S rRNA (guanine(966)-N(2))-methyltransferase RsmD [Cellvibrio fontiphilus]|uniref:Ribosomal RNA small subunit methyltransferase D n=1 Tax=Cellvibrio fontiphilus TaxID=1815559 RepID=A0ABV7FBK3_9GAMM